MPKPLRALIREMAAENPTWGEERIANELKLKLGLRISPRTVEKYLRNGGPAHTPDPQQRWLTFIHNHAKVIVVCDFFVVVTATFRVLYVLVILELRTRRILHHNLTAHPTADWTMQQFREALSGGHPYRFPIHDRDSIFSRRLDQGVTDLGDPAQRATSEDEHQRLGNPLQPGPPHSSLGPGIPEPNQESVPASDHRHTLSAGYRVAKRSVLGGLHHEYRLVTEAA